MQKLFLVIGAAGYALGYAVIQAAPTVLQEVAGMAVITNATMFVIAGLWPSQTRQKIGEGELGGLPFDLYNDGSVVVTDKHRRRTRFPSIEMLERCLQSQYPSDSRANLYFEGWGIKME